MNKEARRKYSIRWIKTVVDETHKLPTRYEIPDWVDQALYPEDYPNEDN